MPEFDQVDDYNNLLRRASLPSRLTMITEMCSAPIFTTSLGREDQFLLWNIYNENLPIRFATLQTGRLFQQTNSLLTITRERYGVSIEELLPDPQKITEFASHPGLNSIYESVENREACCTIRKINPLGHALKTVDGWITGLTREQSQGRSELPFVQWDNQYDLMKFNPLADISNADISAAIAAHEIPVNPLHERGYPSIGCEPCTRAIKEGEHPRAGRWWWENDSSSECGLHNTRDTPASQSVPYAVSDDGPISAPISASIPEPIPEKV